MLTGEWSMIRTGRGAPQRPVMHATLACLFGLALACCALAAPTGPAAGADDNSSELFAILDPNGDGVVTREEFLRMKTEIFYRRIKNLDQDQRLSPQDVHLTPEAFAEADLDGDGKLSGSEFVQAPFSQFDSIDANGDQKIDIEEFGEFIQQYRF
jgi:Ca2+-binding EF-hand superfamily protein